MYKTRGKPEDPWNRAAAAQEKRLAETIQVNHILRDGPIEQHQRFSWSPTARQKERDRRHNYEEYKGTHHERIRKSNLRPLKNSEEISEENSCHGSHSIIKRFVSGRLNDSHSNDDTKGCRKLTMLRAPQRTVKPIKVEVPVRYKEAAIFCLPKSVGSESLPFLRKLKELEKLQDLCETRVTTSEESVQTDLVRELEDVSFEVDVGNAQLEQIKKLLQATRALDPIKEEDKDDEIQDNTHTSLYNVKPAHQKSIAAPHKEVNVGKKSKLLLTLNDVNARIQKMQARFFKDESRPYRSIKTNSSKNLYSEKKVSYENSSKKPNKKHMKNSSACVQETISLHSHQNDQNRSKIKEISPVSDSADARLLDIKQMCLYDRVEASPRFIELPHLNILSTDPFVEEFINNFPADRDETDVTLEAGDKKDGENVDTKSVLQPKMQESILNSDFLMKEFDIDMRDMHFDMNKFSSILQNKISKKKNVHFYQNPVEKLREDRIARNTAKARNKSIDAAPADFALKHTLYCVDEE